MIRVTWQELDVYSLAWVDKSAVDAARDTILDKAKAEIIAYLGGPGRPPYRALKFQEEK